MSDRNSAARAVLVTVRDLIRFGVSRFNGHQLFFGHGSDNGWDEAVYLVLHALLLPADQLDPFMDAHVLPDEKERVLDLIDRRCMDRVPAAYLTNEAWLQGYRFFVDQRVIVPRSPIAELLVAHLSPWIPYPDDISHILDLCTGSGCLAIIAAHEFPDAVVDATDISSDALEVAKINVQEHGLADRLSLYQGSLFESLNVNRRYDLIICNPPYVNSTTMDQLPKEYLHEPRLALAGGTDGMDLIRNIIEQAPQHLSEQGMLLLELGHERAYFDAAFPDLAPMWLDTTEATDQILLLTREQLLT